MKVPAAPCPHEELRQVPPTILELEGKDTLRLSEVKTGARLALRDGKDGEHACHHYLEINLVNYANKKYTQYMS